MNTKLLISALGIIGLGFGAEKLQTPEKLHQWVLEMHRAQIELLKINWGNPGFCTEWDKGLKNKNKGL